VKREAEMRVPVGDTQRLPALAFPGRANR